MRRLFLFSFLHFCLLLISQTVTPAQADKTKDEKSIYYHDTSFTVSGAKIDIYSAKSSWDKFKCSIEIENPTTNYLIIDPNDIRGHLKGSDKSFHDKRDGMLVVAPKSTKKFKVKFDQYDFLQPNIEIRIDKICSSDTIVAVYDIKDISLSIENQRVSGPISWSYYREDVDKNDGIRIHGKLKYRGDKFLLFYPENAAFKTPNGTFNSVADQSYIGNYNHTYVDRFNKFEKTLFVFPVKKREIKKGSKSTMDLVGVFKEYSLKKTDGFTIVLRKNPEGNKSKKGDDTDVD